MCCFSELATYVRVSGDDYERLGDLGETLVHFVENKAYLRMIDGHCAALVIDVENAAFVCSAYDVRPSICRDLDRGSPQCVGEREGKGDRPRDRLVQLRADRGQHAQKEKGPTPHRE